MKSNLNNNQKILVFVCDEHKFAHIGVFNMMARSGKANYSGSLNGYAIKAKRMKNLLPSRDAKGTDSAFGNSFLVRLINTGSDKWSTREQFFELDINEARNKAFELYEKYEAMGYSVTGSKGNKAIRQKGEKPIKKTL